MRVIQKCDEGEAPWFFSRYASGHDKGPNKKYIYVVLRHIETNGYKCGCGDLVQVYKNGKTYDK